MSGDGANMATEEEAEEAEENRQIGSMEVNWSNYCQGKGHRGRREQRRGQVE